ISLSRWFRDYVYIPLGGNRRGPVRTYVNLFTIFFLCGLWHGASWTFVVWGMFHGALLVLERAFLGRLLARTPRAVQHVYTLLLVMIGWVFFRATSLAQAVAFLRAMFDAGDGARMLLPDHYLTSFSLSILILGAALSMPIWPAAVALAKRHTRPADDVPWVWGAAHLADGALCLSLLALSCLAIAAGTYNPFIYFRF
ncbi:MAG TPA: MBOAT family O-acyltransferase, partial [Myxococcota bacterium]|nr:MBOAT family O-acyltransferase [Myxococcota bacterium]